MSNTSHLSKQLFELGQLYCDRGDFFLAIEKLKEAALLFRADNNTEHFLKSQNLLLRLYAETENRSAIKETKDILQVLAMNEGVELGSKTYYTLALCSAYRGQTEAALGYLQKSIAIALAKDQKEDLCYGIAGTAAAYARMGRYQDALREIYNLKVFFDVLDLPDLKTSVHILNGHILRELKRYDQALEVLWGGFEMVKAQKMIVTYVYLLYNLAQTYHQMGDRDLSRIYYDLLRKTVDPKNMVRLHKAIERDLKDYGLDGKSTYDLIFDYTAHAVTERKLGKIDFRNQFILLDLLGVFIQNQGKVYSKEYLVQHVWKQDYDPAVHDNKIYVTIKRLRKMIEPDFDKPRYIFRAKNGYFMNKSARVFLQSKESPS